MPTYRGVDGFLSLGGAVDASVYIKTAVAQGLSAATLDGNGSSLNGVILPGDTFTVAGDAEDPYTIVTGGVFVSDELAITFSPVIQEAAGWAENAAVDLDSNLIAQIRSWSAEVARDVLDITCMQATGKAKTLDIPDFRGRAEALLDYGDTEQKELIDQVVAGALATAMGLVLGADDGRQLYGNVLASGFVVTGQIGQIFTVEFQFEGSGAIAMNWKAA